MTGATARDMNYCTFLQQQSSTVQIISKSKTFPESQPSKLEQLSHILSTD